MSPVLRRVVAGHGLAAVAMSLPWPLLLALVWDRTGDPRLLGLVGALRLLPYVACSWWVPAWADRAGRTRVLRATVVARLVLLGVVAVALAEGALGVAVVGATAAVLVATPAYPALAASMPRLAGPSAGRATDLLVTAEVCSFVVGPALGGLLLIRPGLVGPIALATMVAAAACLSGVRLPREGRSAGVGGLLRALHSPDVLRCLGVLAGLNAVLAVTALALLPLAGTSWAAAWRPDHAYGVSSGVLGLGALAGPALARLGRGAASRSRLGLGLLAAALVVVAVTPSVGWSLAPLGVVGAAAVHVEGAVTGLLQATTADHLRAGVLGTADAVMVAAAMVGSLVAPTVAEAVGGPLLLALLAAAALACALLVSARAAAEHDGGAPIVVLDDALGEARLLEQVG